LLARRAPGNVRGVTIATGKIGTTEEAPTERTGAAARDRLTLLLFAATLTANAALVFTVEPMITKMVLPLLGGTPSVWATCLMFFQALLLAGYLYAHLGARWLAPRVQMLVHVGLFALSLLALPVAVARGFVPPTGEGGAPPVAWLVLLLLASLGAPFFVLSAGAPLLQRWFAHTGHRDAGNPYFLYAASNAGSLVALLAYPLLLEPRLTLAEQSRGWSVAYWSLGVLVLACAAAAAHRAHAPPTDAGAGDAAAAGGAPSAARRVEWVLLSFVPSSLLMGVTQYLTTDVAPVPLLWVVPLALYLLTFVIAFARSLRVPLAGAAAAQALLLPPLAIVVALGANRPLSVIGSLHLAAFLATALVCHLTLAERRPGVAHLTEFYLWMSVGGLLGGVFNVLVAPVAYDTLLEYPLVLALAAALRPPRQLVAPAAPAVATGAPVAGGRLRSLARLAADPAAEPPTRARELALSLGVPAVVGTLMGIAGARFAFFPSAPDASVEAACGGLAAVIAFRVRAHRRAFALAIVAMLAGGWLGQRTRYGGLLLQERSFFGTYAVRVRGDHHHLTHGTTLHGAQSVVPHLRREPLTYYHRNGPLGQLFASMFTGLPARRVAVVGLGTGTVACYGRRGERWTFYEIDPLVERIARDARYFTYLRDCPPTVTVVIGDARLRLAEAPPAAYDLIVVDAFSSDAIPVHLLTREALALYLSKLADGGAVALHISNRYLNLVPVLAELARDARVAGVIGRDVRLTGDDIDAMKTTSAWVVLSRRARDLGGLARREGWDVLPASGDRGLWTDDFSNVVRVINW
jgi:hypothetical protein